VQRNASSESLKSSKKIVIIGGVAGGATAAARARRLAEDANIVLLERGSDVSFANCGMPYYISGEIKDRAKLAVQTPKSLSDILGIEVRTQTEAIEIDRKTKTVKVIDRTSNAEEKITYDKLILAPGAAPVKPPISGIDSVASHVFTLRSLKDMDRIFARVSTVPKPRHVVVVGAGCMLFYFVRPCNGLFSNLELL
jgi:NADPH-dependent 2,4-dienoyl-CoA reductase/sulfur reductase-like enzyme